MILAQYSDILLPSKASGPVPPALSFSYKLYHGKHVPDHVHIDLPKVDVGPSRVFLTTL